MNKFLLFFLLFFFNSFAQKYTYNEIFIRNSLGKFDKLEKEGKFEIKNDSVYIFEQSLKIHSTRFIFGEKSLYSGKIYTCTDGSYFYTIFLTKELELYFYTREEEMFKIILK